MECKSVIKLVANRRIEDIRANDYCAHFSLARIDLEVSIPHSQRVHDMDLKLSAHKNVAEVAAWYRYSIICVHECIVECISVSLDKTLVYL